MPAGAKFSWMIFKSKKSGVTVVRDVEWAGADGLEGFIIPVICGQKELKFFLTKKCGNLTLVQAKPIPVAAPAPVQPPKVVERVVEKIVQVPGPERMVEVPGPERVVERVVEVPGPERVVEVPAYQSSYPYQVYPSAALDYYDNRPNWYWGGDIGFSFYLWPIGGGWWQDQYSRRHWQPNWRPRHDFHQWHSGQDRGRGDYDRDRGYNRGYRDYDRGRRQHYQHQPRNQPSNYQSRHNYQSRQNYQPRNYSPR